MVWVGGIGAGSAIDTIPYSLEGEMFADFVFLGVIRENFTLEIF